MATPSKSNSQVTTLDDPVNPDVNKSTEVAPAPASARSIASGDAELSGKKRIITIHQTGNEADGEVAELQLNGYLYRVPRGVPCEVPEEVYQILDNAKTTTYQTTPAGVVERHNFRFPFSAH